MPVYEEKANTLQLANGNAAAQQKLTDWVNEPSLMTLKDDLRISKQMHDTQSTQIKKWLALRDAESTAKSRTAPENRSKIQPKLIRRQAEWRYSALAEPFLSAPKVVTVSPVTWEDSASAQQNELVLNWQYRTKMNWVDFIDEYVRTTVDEGTCILRLGWERHTVMELVEVPEWTYVEATEVGQMEELQKAAQLKMDNPRGFSELPEEIQKSVDYGLEMNVPALAYISGYSQVEQEKVIRNQPSVEVMEFDNCYLDPTCNGNVEKANFVIFSFETSKADLLKDGRYKNLQSVNWGGASPYLEPDHSTKSDGVNQFQDELRKRVVAYEYWGFYDINGDETLVPIVATWVAGTMIRMELNPFPDQELPVVVVKYLPLKKSIAGEPDAELLEENQAILGAITRGMIDLMGRSANGQTGFAKGMLDPVNRRRFNAGSDYEFNPNQPPQSGMIQHKYPEIPQSALTMLQLQNQEAEALTGVKAFSGGMSGNAYGDVAAGIRGMLDAASKREMGILRRLAAGMEKVSRKFASMNAVFMTEEETVRVTNEKFVVVQREDLIGNFDLKINIATAEVDEAKAKDLSFMLQTMGNNMDFAMTQMILAEIARLKQMPELSHKIKTFAPTPDPLQQKLKELEVAKLEKEIAEIDSKIQLNLSKARAEASTADKTDLDFVEQESGTKHVRDMAKQQAQGDANEKLEITKRILTPDYPGSKGNDVDGALAFQAMSKAGQ